MVADTASVASEYTYAVCLVHHDGGVVLVLQLNDFGQLAQIALHGEDAVDDNQFDALGCATLEDTFQVGHVVVLVSQLGGKTQTAAIHYGGMVAVVADDIIVLAQQLGYDAAVYGETCSEYQSVVLAYEVGQFLFQFYVYIQCAIEETTAGAAAAVLSHGCHSGFNDTVVSGQSGVCVAAEHQYFMATHGYFGALFAFYFSKVGVNAFCLNFVWQGVLGQFLV